jgi:DNA-binding MarR family transcriptional regulator
MPETKIWNKNMPLSRFTSLITKAYYGALTKRLEHLDMEHYYSILITIEDQKGGHCSQQFLCNLLQVDKASMVKKIDYLAKRGLVKRGKNPRDRREHIINLTEKAIQILPEIHEAVNDLNTNATRGLNSNQREEFYEALWLVYENIITEPANQVSYKIKKIKDQKPQ